MISVKEKCTDIKLVNIDEGNFSPTFVLINQKIWQLLHLFLACVPPSGTPDHGRGSRVRPAEFPATPSPRYLRQANARTSETSFLVTDLSESGQFFNPPLGVRGE